MAFLGLIQKITETALAERQLPEVHDERLQNLFTIWKREIRSAAHKGLRQHFIIVRSALHHDLADPEDEAQIKAGITFFCNEGFTAKPHSLWVPAVPEEWDPSAGSYYSLEHRFYNRTLHGIMVSW